jgi:hypothetical protein
MMKKILSLNANEGKAGEIKDWCGLVFSEGESLK